VEWSPWDCLKQNVTRNTVIIGLNLGCLHPVARVISYDVGFNPSTQRHYRRLIYNLYIHGYMFRSYDHHQAWSGTIVTLRRRIKTHVIRHHRNLFVGIKIRYTPTQNSTLMLFFNLRWNLQSDLFRIAFSHISYPLHALYTIHLILGFILQRLIEHRLQESPYSGGAASWLV
jgi:hypothetical protein